ncbi:MAG: polysaccharide biosynthesis/export family protein [Alistipes sp.]|nr:polysaccharide biosynthesis/export family protein [Alistipes sp.]
MRTRIYLMCCLLLALLSSCASSKKLLYFQDWESDEALDISVKHEAVIHPDDRLSIVVSCDKPELALPFNNQNGVVSVSADGTSISAEQGATNKEVGYRVDNEGCIVFPKLGKLKVEGLKVTELSELIRNKIVAGNYINDPSISIEFLNFKYVMIGAVGSGVYSVDGDRITLVEAIAKAGDLPKNARLDRVIVIREVDGKRVQFVHDMRSKDIFNSPCYYLQQNDIVYVEPKTKRTDTESRVLQYISLAASLASTVSVVLWYTTR